MTVVWLAFSAILVWVLPGYTLSTWLRTAASEGGRSSWWDDLGWAGGLSFALWSTLSLLCHLLGIYPGILGAGLVSGFSLVSLGLGFWLRRGAARPSMRSLSAGLVFAIGLVGWRVFQTRMLAFPNWVDSVHHALIVKQFMRWGGIPPAIQLDSPAPFYYHFGYHLTTAVFGGLNQLEADRAVMLSGLVLYVLLMLSVRLLARSLGLDEKSAWLSGLLISFALYMPAYYLSWGRYPLLSGLVVLAAAIAAAVEMISGEGNQGRMGLRMAMLTAGLALTHYLALLLLGYFVAAMAVDHLMRLACGHRWRGSAERWGVLGISLAAGVALALPWLLPMLRANAALAGMRPGMTGGDAWNFRGFFSLLKPEFSLTLMGIAVLPLLGALFCRQMRSLTLWTLLLLFFSMPFAPQPGPFRPDLFAIVLCLPASILLGWGWSVVFEWIGSRVNRRWAIAGQTAWRLAALLTVGLGVYFSRSLINPETVIATADDRRALDWARDHTPADARFFINNQRWNGEIRVGVDGGYWLLPYAGRMTLIPPLAYDWLPREEVDEINAMGAQSESLESCEMLGEFLRINRHEYMYLSERKGALRPRLADRCAELAPVYREAGVVIYKLTGMSLKPAR